MITTYIIGKNSNLSKYLHQKIENSILVSSREIIEGKEIQVKDNSNIIFNNFQPSTGLQNHLKPIDYINNAIMSTALTLNMCKNVKINKVLYTSSSSVYGNNILCNERDDLKPLNLHASLKIANEELIKKFCMEHNIDYTIARVFNMYGGDDKFSIISKIIKAHKKDETLTIVNHGNAIRDFIHIDDVVDIYFKLLDKKDIPYLNIGTGIGNSIKNILDFLNNHNVQINTNNIKREELKISTADIKLLDKNIEKTSFKNIEDYLKKEFNI